MLEINANETVSDAKMVVVGVGGGGNNAIDRMIDQNIAGVDFIAVNTDLQALKTNLATTKVQIGEKETKGLGAGSKPEVGIKAAEESRDELEQMLVGYDMAFITCGMGGGTGTGAAPIIASLAKSQGILTVGVVTKPFGFEGRGRMNTAIRGIEELKKNVDSLIVIPNDNIFGIIEPDTTTDEAFKMIDQVLLESVSGISDLIFLPGIVNVDFADLRTVLMDSGIAHIGIGRGKGKDKAIDAAKAATASPLLETTINGATNLLVNYSGNKGVTMFSIKEAADYINNEAGDVTNVIQGQSINEALDDEFVITVIATGFSGENSFEPYPEPAKAKDDLEDATEEVDKEDAESSEGKDAVEEQEDVTEKDEIDVPIWLKRHKKK